MFRSSNKFRFLFGLPNSQRISAACLSRSIFVAENGLTKTYLLENRLKFDKNSGINSSSLSPAAQFYYVVGLLNSLNGKSKQGRQQNSTQLRPFHTSSTLLADEIIEVAGPAFAESITEGDIKWMKKKGDFIRADELVAQIETDKTVVDVPSPQTGVIVELLVAEGAKVGAKQKLFTMKLTSEAPPGAAPAAAAEPKKAQEPAKAAPPPPSKPAAPAPPRAAPPPPPAQPMRAAAPPPSLSQATPRPAPAVALGGTHVSPEKAITGTRTETRVKMNRMRLRIAQRLKDAQNTYAMLTTFNEIDMSNILALRARYKDAFAKKHGVKFGLMSPFVKASAYALLDQPVLNAVIDEGEIVYRHFIDISIAVATEKGLVVPVLRNVETMNYAQIEHEINDLGEKARDNKLAIEDMEGGTFTISNGGVFGSLMGTPIINPPQSAILGMHATNDRPVSVNGKVEIRPMMFIALTYDHRLIDGREAVTFLKKVKQAVEDPALMLLDL